MWTEYSCFLKLRNSANLALILGVKYCVPMIAGAHSHAPTNGLFKMLRVLLFTGSRTGGLDWRALVGLPSVSPVLMAVLC